MIYDSWCTILLEVAIMRWVSCGYKWRYVVSNNRLWHLKDSLLVDKGYKMCQDNIPQIISQP